MNIQYSLQDSGLGTDTLTFTPLQAGMEVKGGGSGVIRYNINYHDTVNNGNEIIITASFLHRGIRVEADSSYTLKAHSLLNVE